MAEIKKGQVDPLNVTLKARHRVMCGLGWDPADEPGLIDKVKALAGKQDNHHDLDLTCYIYDEGLNLIELVSADPERLIDSTEMIYHSGDNEEGIGEGDDEEISAELKELPASICHLVFAAIIRTSHSFSEIASPEIRLADGYTDHNFLQTALDDEAGKDKNAFIFAGVSRDASSETGWVLQEIGEYMNYTGDADFPVRVGRFLERQD